MFKSSAHYYGAEQDDPGFFTESMGRPHPPRTRIERDIVEAEATVADFAEKNPDVGVAILRFANVLGPTVRTAHARLFSLPVVPMILGFDPRYQFVHEDDVVHALEHVVRDDVRGIYNVAADGVLALQRGGRPARARPTRRSCRRGAPGWRRRCSAGSACGCRRRCCSRCASGAGSTTASSRRPASATATRPARP